MVTKADTICFLFAATPILLFAWGCISPIPSDFDGHMPLQVVFMLLAEIPGMLCFMWLMIKYVHRNFSVPMVGYRYGLMYVASVAVLMALAKRYWV
jgi:hypothetical protein